MAARDPRTVPAGRGVAWAREGLEILAAAPVTWVGITVLFVLMGVVLAVIPFAGMLWSVAVPIHTGGLMLGCRALREGRPLEVRYLFNGFEAPRLQPLALVGALYVAGSLIVMLPLLVLVIGGSVVSAVALGSTGGSVGSLAGIGILGFVMVALTMAAGMALSLALWFAPALVVFDDVAALDALKLSLRAGWANVGAFVVYGLVVLGVGLVAAGPLVATILLVAARGSDQSGALAAVLLGGTGLFAFVCILLLLPAAWGAMYASYDDVFGEQF
jgi:hypothetical protein